MDTDNSSAPAPPSTVETCLAKLEKRYGHQLLAVEESLELRELIVGLRRRLGLPEAGELPIVNAQGPGYPHREPRQRL